MVEDDFRFKLIYMFSTYFYNVIYIFKVIRF